MEIATIRSATPHLVQTLIRDRHGAKQQPETLPLEQQATAVLGVHITTAPAVLALTVVANHGVVLETFAINQAPF